MTGTRRTGVLIAVCAGLAVAGVALADGGEGFAEPTEERPWPYVGHDAQRTYNAGQPETAVNPTTFQQTRRIGDLADDPFYVSATVVDLDKDSAPEIATTLYGFLGSGGIAAYDADGTELWNDTPPGRPGLPVAADFDDDNDQEIYVSAGDSEQRLYEPNGTLAWTAETPEPYDTEDLATKGLVLDINDDGARDVVTNAAMPFPDQGTLSEIRHGEAEAAILYGLDGRTGERLFANEICGHRLASVVGLQPDADPLIAVGCMSGNGNRSSGAVEGIRIQEKDDGPLRTALDSFGLALREETTYEAKQVWRTEIHDTEPRVMHTIGADVHPHDGREVVAFWYNETGNGLTALDAATGDVVAQGFDDTVSQGFITASAAAGDLDGDGLSEVIFDPGTSDNHEFVAYSLADGDLERHLTIPQSSDEFRNEEMNPDGVSLADHDRDGTPEIWTDWAEANRTRESEGFGGQHRVYDENGNLLSNTTLKNDPDESEHSPEPNRYHAIADLDGDGTLEQIQPISETVAIYDASPTDVDQLGSG